jgi:16S rRNA (guanine966-N2)-methyltransferase
LRFPDVLGLRPTPDRVRETLFNWLQTVLPGTRCLDLFAGSGALGVEALSRGAAHATLVEYNPMAAVNLRHNLAVLGAEGARVVQADALAYLQTGDDGVQHAYDIVFLDPPFERPDLLETGCKLLEHRDWLAPRAYIYLESASRDGPPTLPPRWRIVRSQQAGQVAYRLALRVAPREHP